MDQRLNGENPLSYRGVNAYSPPDFVMYKRSPTSKDYKNFIIGTIWLDYSVQPPDATSIYMLTRINKKVATWIQFAVAPNSIETLTGDAGGPVHPDASKNINILSYNTGLEFTGNPGTNTLSLDVTGGYTLFRSLTDDASTPVYPNVLGQIQLDGTGGITTLSDPSNHKIVIDGSGITGIQTFTEDVGTAAPALGNVNVYGGTLISTSGATDTITIDSSAVGSLESDSGTAGVALNKIKLVGAGTVTTSASGDTITITESGGAGYLDQCTADDLGVATPTAGNINIFGTADHVSTSAATDTVTIDTAADVATQFDCDSGSAVPLNGVLNVVGGTNISTAGSSNIVTISATTPPTGLITYFVSSGTWTKNPATQYVTIYLWCGGGGGGGGYTISGSGGGGGGGSGGAVYVMLNEPAATFGASETIVVGAGGSGGASNNDGSSGGVSSVGSIIVPPAQTNYGRDGYLHWGFAGGAVPITMVGGTTFYASGGGAGGRIYTSGAFSNDHTISAIDNASLAGTGGGGGAGTIQYTPPTTYILPYGGASGSQKLPNGTVIVAGQPGGGNSQTIPNDGLNGNDGYIYNNIMVGGTGGSGSGVNSTSFPLAYVVYGGNGGFPGAGGGGSGVGRSQGGSGGNGLVIIIEF